MSDPYLRFTHTRAGRLIAGRTGLPRPPVLDRWTPGRAFLGGPLLLGATDGGRLAGPVTKILDGLGADLRDTDLRGTDTGTNSTAGGDTDAAGIGRYAALVFDATGITTSGDLRALFDFFHPTVRTLSPSGRVLVLGTAPEDCADPREATAQRALEGFVRSVGKEAKDGATAQLVYASPGAETALASTLRFLLSARSAYVSGQVVRVGPAPVAVVAPTERPLAGATAVVTGAGRGLGEAIATTLARDGAHVVAVDVAAQRDALQAVARRIDGTPLVLDLADPEAPAALAFQLRSQHGGIDVVVHNVGITRDKTLARMTSDQWDSVLDVNLSSQERVDDALLGDGMPRGDAVLRDGGRIVAVSSIAGIGGNLGQTNYATSMAGVAGRVNAMAPVLAARGGSINAVAPGFIETRMTASIPLFVREAGRRMNSLNQGGLPIDVAETVAWLADPASVCVNGNTVRVCGQSLLGA